MSGALDEQVAYYRARASDYDDEAYDSKSDDWHAEMARLVDAFDRSTIVGDVIELAAGTGRWTARLAARASSVTALDVAPEMLAIARRRAPAARLLCVDVLRWTPPPECRWDAVVACFWLAHVPDGSLAAMLSTMASAVRPGGTVFVADKVHGNHRTERTLRDGRSFTVIDRTRPVDEWVAAFDVAGFDVSVETMGKRFVAISGARR